MAMPTHLMSSVQVSRAVQGEHQSCPCERIGIHSCHNSVGRAPNLDLAGMRARKVSALHMNRSVTAQRAQLC